MWMILGYPYFRKPPCTNYNNYPFLVAGIRETNVLEVEGLGLAFLIGPGRGKLEWTGWVLGYFMYLDITQSLPLKKNMDIGNQRNTSA